MHMLMSSASWICKFQAEGRGYANAENPGEKDMQIIGGGRGYANDPRAHEYANCMQMRGVGMQFGDVRRYANDLMVPGYANEGRAAQNPAGMQMRSGGGRGHADEGEATPTDRQMRSSRRANMQMPAGNVNMQMQKNPRGGHMQMTQGPTVCK